MVKEGNVAAAQAQQCGHECVKHAHEERDEGERAECAGVNAPACKAVLQKVFEILAEAQAAEEAQVDKAAKLRTVCGYVSAAGNTGEDDAEQHKAVEDAVEDAQRLYGGTALVAYHGVKLHGKRPPFR
ncbi:MAG: hypothetical protein ACLSB9_25405 [Hydrogeniiclostridium mannosilyticum]